MNRREFILSGACFLLLPACYSRNQVLSWQQIEHCFPDAKSLGPFWRSESGNETTASLLAPNQRERYYIYSPPPHTHLQTAILEIFRYESSTAAKEEYNDLKKSFKEASTRVFEEHLEEKLPILETYLEHEKALGPRYIAHIYNIIVSTAPSTVGKPVFQAAVSSYTACIG